MKTFLLVAVLVSTAAFAKHRTLIAPRDAKDVRSFTIQPNRCPQRLQRFALPDGGTRVQPLVTNCEEGFIVVVTACALFEDGGVSGDCGDVKVRLNRNDASLQRLWDAAKPEWEKAKGY